MEAPLIENLWSICDPAAAAFRFDVFDRLTDEKDVINHWRQMVLTGHYGLADMHGADGAVVASLIFEVTGKRFHVVGLLSHDPQSAGITEAADGFCRRMACEFDCDHIWMRTAREGLAEKLFRLGWQPSGFEMRMPV